MKDAEPADAPVTALVMAGSRPGGDPLAARFGVARKALIEIGGEAMLARVARTLAAHPRIGRVMVLAQQAEQLRQEPRLAAIAGNPAIAFRESGATIGATMETMLAQEAAGLPFLVTTADSALLSGDMLDSFLEGAAGSDLAVGMVERRTLLERYPQSRRTWLKFRGGWWSGANLFWIGSARVAPVIGIWRGVEQERKKARRIVGAFGPVLLAAIALRLWTIHQAVTRVGRRFDIVARIVPLPQAEACIDVDKPEDAALAEHIIAAGAR